MNAKLAKQIENVIQQLHAIKDELSGSSVFPEGRYKLIEQGICLSCEEKIESGKVVRGCHDKCRHEQQKDKTKTDAFFVKLGLLAPVGKTGRKPKNRLEKKIAEASIVADAKAGRKKHDK